VPSDNSVVHVAYEDAVAYASWAGGMLASEAQWEFAARGGLDGADFTWGDEQRPGGRIMANTRDGPDFPWRSTRESGFTGTSPVGSFPPNGYGLFDMAGNVWEWTDDWHTASHPAIADKVIEGGSHVCADTYCRRYRPAARRPQMIDTGMSHIGMRVVCAETS